MYQSLIDQVLIRQAIVQRAASPVNQLLTETTRHI
jgi:hypothetical protein